MELTSGAACKSGAQRTRVQRPSRRLPGSPAGGTQRSRHPLAAPGRGRRKPRSRRRRRLWSLRCSLRCSFPRSRPPGRLRDRLRSRRRSWASHRGRAASGPSPRSSLCCASEQKARRASTRCLRSQERRAALPSRPASARCLAAATARLMLLQARPPPRRARGPSPRPLPAGTSRCHRCHSSRGSGARRKQSSPLMSLPHGCPSAVPGSSRRTRRLRQARQ
mmetsp:Transcript_2320/g.6886  ORF Transcript_2320/g.6886 Transcript_2320/m.6886 type:complete len:221 (-) Transcript_2320:939-1601(-)